MRRVTCLGVGIPPRAIECTYCSQEIAVGDEAFASSAWGDDIYCTVRCYAARYDQDPDVRDHNEVTGDTVEPDVANLKGMLR